MLESTQEGINKVMALLQEGQVEDALEFVNILEKRKDLADFELISFFCVDILKPVII
ncbi:MAG: hypothetical protein ACFFBC_04200 [Promethearchaeota archaeon]